MHRNVRLRQNDGAVRGRQVLFGTAPGQRGRITLVRAIVGLQNSSAQFATVMFLALTFIVITAVFYINIRRQDIELSFDQLSAFERHVHTSGNKTIYSVDASQKDAVFATLPHDDWTKISKKIDFIAFMYNDVYSMTSGSESLDHLFRLLSQELETITPHGYGIVLFECGCILHNVLFQHVSTRFDGMECTMLPGFVFGKEAVRWAEISMLDGACEHRDRILGQPWFVAHSSKLPRARSEFALVREHLRRVQHPDRLEPE